jgi:23S rRNA-/tRNA-specific pseudouridylate synthase
MVILPYAQSLAHSRHSSTLHLLDAGLFTRHLRQRLARTINRQALHSAQLEFLHPESREVMSFEAALPAELEKLIAKGDQ